MNDVYEDLFLNSDNDFQPPEKFIDSLITCITEEVDKDKVAITDPPPPQISYTYLNPSKFTKSAGF